MIDNDQEFGMIIAGEFKSFTPVERILLQVGDKGETIESYLDDKGFLRSSADDKRLLSLGQLTKRAGGIVIGEGDVGKTSFSKMFYSSVKNLGFAELVFLRHVFDPMELARKFESAASAAGSTNQPAFLILDGLDENKRLIGVIQGLIAKNNSNVRIWVTSRPCDEVDSLCNGYPKIGRMYKLMPLARYQVTQLATDIGVDGNSFMLALRNARMINFASKPGGLRLLLEIYANRGFESYERWDLFEGMSIGLATKSNNGRSSEITSGRFSTAKLLEVAGWICSAIFLKGVDYLWTGSKFSCPPDSIALEEIPLNETDSEVVSELKERRLFEPMPGCRYRVSFKDLPNFLVARWLTAKLSDDQLLSFFEGKDVQDLSADFLEVAAWVSQKKPNAVGKVVLRYPDYFLSSVLAIQSVGTRRFLDAIGKRYCSLSYGDRDDRIRYGLESLSGNEDAADWALEILNGPLDVNPLMPVLAAAVLLASNRRFEVGYKALIKALKSDTLSVETKSYISSYLVDLLGEERPQDITQLKAELMLKDGSNDGLSLCGNLLKLFWPKYLDTKGVSEFLSKHKAIAHKALYGFDWYLEKEFPETFSSCLNENNVIPLLKWAAKHCNNVVREDCFARLSRMIVNFAWRFADDEFVAQAILDCCKKPDERSHINFLPFDFKLSSKEKQFPWEETKEEFLKNQSRRLKFFSRCVACREIDGDRLLISQFDDYPLVIRDDFESLYELWSGCDNDWMAERYANALAHMVSLERIHKWPKKFTELRTKYPDRPQFDEKFVASQDTKWKEMEAKARKDEAERVAAEESAKSEHKEGIQKYIREHEASSELFLTMAFYIPSNNGRQEIPEGDIKRGVQWQYFDDAIKNKLLTSAIDTVRNYDIMSAPRNTLQYEAFASAVRWVWNDKKDVILTLPEERISCIVSSLMRNHCNEPDRAEIDLILEWLVKKSPKACESGVLKELKLELNESIPSVTALRHWSHWLSNDFIQKVFEICKDEANEFSEKKLIAVLDVLWQLQGGSDTRFAAVDEFFERIIVDVNDFARKCPLVFCRAMAFKPGKYCSLFVDVLKGMRDSDGAALFERYMESPHDGYVCAAFSQTDVLSALDMFLWSDKIFPRELYKSHEDDGKLSVRDNISDYQTFSALYRLYNTRSKKVLKRLEEMANPRYENLLLRVRLLVSESHKIEPFSETELKELYCSPKDEGLEELPGKAAKKKKKTSNKGVCPYSGYEVHKKIYIVPGESVKVKAKLYEFTAASAWKIFNRFFKAIKCGEDQSLGHYPVSFTASDANLLHDDAKALFLDCIERQKCEHKERARIYEDKARFRMECLK